MKIKRFIAPDTRQALRQVREELGPDAVVLSSRGTDEGAEVIVAIDYDEKSVADMAERPAAKEPLIGAGAAKRQVFRPTIVNSDSPQSALCPAEGREEAPFPQSEPAPAERPDDPFLRQPAAAPGGPLEEPISGQPAPAAAGQRDEPAARRFAPRPAEPQDEPIYRRSPAPLAEQPSDPSSRQFTAPAAAQRDESMDDLGNELRRLRSALEHQLRYLRKQDPDPQREDVLCLLEQLGVGPALAEGIAADIARNGYSSEHAWGAARAALSEQIAVTENDLVDNGGVVALIGPTGVGKTTTIAKLAARFALRYGRKHVALITTDTHRIGAQEQLRTFGQTLGMEVEPASSRIELRQLLERHRGKRLVLIDNAGFGQRDLRLAAQLADLDCLSFIKTHLVISATAQSAALDEVFAAFGKTGLQGCILTKIDEAVSLGPVIQTLAHYRLPLAYTCDGQRIPEDIRPGSSEDLVSRAESLAQSGAPRFAPEDNYYSRRLAANGLA